MLTFSGIALNYDMITYELIAAHVGSLKWGEPQSGGGTAVQTERKVHWVGERISLGSTADFLTSILV